MHSRKNGNYFFTTFIAIQLKNCYNKTYVCFLLLRLYIWLIVLYPIYKPELVKNCISVKEKQRKGKYANTALSPLMFASIFVIIFTEWTWYRLCQFMII